MHYWIYLKKKESYTYYEDALLDYIPKKILSLLTATFAFDINLCEKCHLDCYCHPIEKQSGLKYCTIFFHDVFKPKWKLEDVF